MSLQQGCAEAKLVQPELYRHIVIATEPKEFLHTSTGQGLARRSAGGVRIVRLKQQRDVLQFQNHKIALSAT
jgi:hypothetical protein